MVYIAKALSPLSSLRAALDGIEISTTYFRFGPWNLADRTENTKDDTASQLETLGKPLSRATGPSVGYACLQQPGGGATGVTGALIPDNGLVPTSFVATTKHSYASPLVSPETVMGEVGLEPKENMSPKQ